jgi:hypothetical protein
LAILVIAVLWLASWGGWGGFVGFVVWTSFLIFPVILVFWATVIIFLFCEFAIVWRPAILVS